MVRSHNWTWSLAVEKIKHKVVVKRGLGCECGWNWETEYVQTTAIMHFLFLSSAFCLHQLSPLHKVFDVLAAISWIYICVSFSAKESLLVAPMVKLWCIIWFCKRSITWVWSKIHWFSNRWLKRLIFMDVVTLCKYNWRLVLIFKKERTSENFVSISIVVFILFNLWTYRIHAQTPEYVYENQLDNKEEDLAESPHEEDLVLIFDSFKLPMSIVNVVADYA